MPSRGRAACTLLACLVSTACTREPDYEGCNVERPAFLVTVTALPSWLPEDTRLRVRYGGGTESYVLGQPSPRPDVVFCAELAPADAGTPTDVPDAALPIPGAPIEALLCELWTQGAATLTVEASGYPAAERDLRARRDDCGIETVEDVIRLSAPDAGD